MEHAGQLREAGLKRELGFGAAFSGGEDPCAMIFNHGATNPLVNPLCELFRCHVSRVSCLGGRGDEFSQ